MKTYHRYNFFKHTFCIFIEQQNLPLGAPDYTSKNGSTYYFTPDGVYRESNHWGRAANCRWPLQGKAHHSQKRSVGFARWEDFYPNDEDQLIFYIEKTDKGYRYNHKNNPRYDGKAVLRSASATQKILKQIKEIEANPSWMNYFKESTEELQKYFIDQLIYSKTSLHALKANKLNL